ncbi:ATP-dependent RNA helicase RhlE [Corynebacterium ciconiae DSM 44920]|uniref:DEAD/DEAH box helicase n=1 Tax=Corynebacterium ciconiae TaxID=227319 RepID=UPI00035EC523|nr:DEAD/DEAH box helicase [Corynebacterium ciconiae]WKD61142.1 ATP-dependent RNA helicase RhlE [Corynebacterium ciconiae DSM 44920]
MHSFRDLALPDQLVHELTRRELTHPTAIQQATIPDALSGASVIGRSHTGSGKTFAFALPLITRLATDEHLTRSSTPGHPRGLILAPTRELAVQIAERIEDLAAAMGLRTLALTGGVPVATQRTQLAAPVDIAVATPARLLDLRRRSLLQLDAVEIFVVDEADHLAEVGFAPQLDAIAARIPSSAQRLVFSATIDHSTRRLAPAARIHELSAPGATAAVEGLTQWVVWTDSEEQRDQLVHQLARRRASTLIFCATKHQVSRYARETGACFVHSDRTQAQRAAAVERFASGAEPVLIATDVAARGIDIANIDLVVHVGIAFDAQSFVHRSGRTARSGASGNSLSIVDTTYRRRAKKHFRTAGVDPRELAWDSPELSSLIGPLRQPRSSEAQSSTSRRGGSADAGRHSGSPSGTARSRGRSDSSGAGNARRGFRPKKKKKGGAWGKGSVTTRRRIDQ